jgi:hypothetical protein
VFFHHFSGLPGNKNAAKQKKSMPTDNITLEMRKPTTIAIIEYNAMYVFGNSLRFRKLFLFTVADNHFF